MPTGPGLSYHREPHMGLACLESVVFVFVLILIAPQDLWDLSSLTRGQTLALGSELRVLTIGLPGNSREWLLLSEGAF